MPRDSEIVLALLYPAILGTYGDRGNAVALRHRARLRGLPVRVLEIDVEDTVPESADVYLIGGGEDSAQGLAIDPLRRATGMHRALRDGTACLAVCAGFQLLSEEFMDRDGGRRPGLGLLDVRCGRLSGERAVGEVVTQPVGVPGLPPLTGYENHQGDATVGPDAQPLGRVVHGVGNGPSGTEGAVQGSVVATYLHGPVLVRNPALADHLLARVAGPLDPVDDTLVDQLRRERLAAAR